MRRIFCLFIVLIFLSGCALTTIRPPKKRLRKPEPVRKTVVEKVKEVFKPKPEPKRPVVTVEKEEVLPVKPEEKEDIK